MANSSQLFIFLAIAAVFVPSALAVDYVVGDDKGWSNDNVNYTAWADGKTFYLGDNLIFKYPKGSHNVYRVNGTDFKNCTTPAGQNALETGNDVIPLTLAGRKWYICGFDGHCNAGQKLVITVMDMVAPGQSPLPTTMPPPPPSGAVKAVFSGHLGVLAVLIGILGMILA